MPPDHILPDQSCLRGVGGPCVSVERLAATNGRLREGRLWRLLAIHHAPLVACRAGVGVTEDEAVLTVSVATERVTRDLEALRAQGEGMEQSAQAYIADWLTQGWLTRRLPAGAHEEVLELTAEASAALRWLASIQRPQGGRDGEPAGQCHAASVAVWPKRLTRTLPLAWRDYMLNAIA